MRGPLSSGYDIITSSLFIHHLDEDQVASLLRRMAAAAQRLVLINDLRRSSLGLMLAYGATRLLTASPVVHTDGPLSVAAAFTLAEMRQLAKWAGLEDFTVARRWPFRFLLTYRKPPA
jgi:hypothetical protein